MSLKHWPVFEILHQIAYKNVYCAICNDVNVTSKLIPYLMSPDPPSNEMEEIASVDWWPVKVFCHPPDIGHYLNNVPDHVHLKPGSELQRCLKTVLRPSYNAKIVLAPNLGVLRLCGSQLQKIAVSLSAGNLATVLQQLRSRFTIKL